MKPKNYSTYSLLFFILIFFLSPSCAFVEKNLKGKSTKDTITKKERQRKKKLFLTKATTYEEEKKFKKSLSYLKKALNEDPKDKILRGKILTLETNLKRTVKQNIKKGKKLLLRGERREARKKFLLALFFDPDNIDAITSLKNLNFVKAKSSHVKKYKNLFTYTVKPDESLSLIAKKFLGDFKKYTILAQLNDIKKPYKVFPGQKIKIPKDIAVRKGFIPKKSVKKEKKKAAPKKKILASPKKKVVPKKSKTPKTKAVKTPKKDLVKSNRKETTLLKKNAEKITVSSMVPVPPLPNENLSDIFLDAEKLYKKENFDNALKGFITYLESEPDHIESINYTKKINLILTHIEKGIAYRAEGKFLESLDSFHEIMTIKPESHSATAQIKNILPHMILTARILIDDEQSPCEAKLLLKRVLKEDLKDPAARRLLKKAEALEKGLELDCE